MNPKPRNSETPRTHATPIMKNTAFRVVSSTFASEAVESSSSPNAMLMHGKAAPPTAQQVSPTPSINRSVGRRTGRAGRREPSVRLRLDFSSFSDDPTSTTPTMVEETAAESSGSTGMMRGRGAREGQAERAGHSRTRDNQGNRASFLEQRECDAQ